jgi:glucose/arabinose dehydrogenase
MNIKLFFIASLFVFNLMSCNDSNSDEKIPIQPNEPQITKPIVSRTNPNTPADPPPTQPAPLPRGTINYVADLAYEKNDTSCMGFPRIWVDTEKGLCVGLVKAIGGKDNTLRKPRAIVQIPNTEDFIITDMGGWSRKLGKVVKLKKNNSGYDIVDLGLNKLSLAHSVAIGPENKVFIGEDNQIFWFDPSEPLPKKHLVVKNLPMADEKNKHPVTMFIFDKNFNLIVNIGAPSDQCAEDKHKACRFTATSAGLRFYKRTATLEWASNYTLYAKGLRNSMALAIHKESGTLLQAENAMDLKSEFSPFEELNIIEQGKHYGWPYCYDFNNKSPNFSNYDQFNCEADSQNSEGVYQEPWVLLPPHTAPLGMMYYPDDKTLLPHLKGKLIIAYHGYRVPGHRIVYFDVDEQGRPLLSDSETAFYLSDKKSINPSNALSPYNKNFYKDHLNNIPRAAQQKELLKGWFNYPPYRPLGSPVAMTVADNGAIWFVDDAGYKSKSKGIFIIGKYEGSARKLTDVIKEEKITSYDLNSFAYELMTGSETLSAHFTKIRKNYLAKYCAGCHGSTWSTGDQANINKLSSDFYTFVFASGMVKPGSSTTSRSVIAIKSDVRPMPLDPTNQVAALKNIALLESFIDQDLSKLRKVAARALSVRKSPNGEKCNITVKKNMPFYTLETKSTGRINWGRIIVPAKIKKELVQHCGQDMFWIAISGNYTKRF